MHSPDELLVERVDHEDEEEDAIEDLIAQAAKPMDVGRVVKPGQKSPVMVQEGDFE